MKILKPYIDVDDIYWDYPWLVLDNDIILEYVVRHKSWDINPFDSDEVGKEVGLKCLLEYIVRGDI